MLKEKQKVLFRELREAKKTFESRGSTETQKVDFRDTDFLKTI